VPAESTERERRIATLLLNDVQKRFRYYQSRILRCLDELSDREIWWRPNEAANMRQWIVSGLGGAPDLRERDLEFSERGPLPRRELVARLRATVREACRVLEKLDAKALARKQSIQGYRVTGLEAVCHVSEHFSHHAGQIIYITKMTRGKDLRLTKLPVIKKKK
jgi:glutathione S-transferase